MLLNILNKAMIVNDLHYHQSVNNIVHLEHLGVFYCELLTIALTKINYFIVFDCLDIKIITVTIFLKI